MKTSNFLLIFGLILSFILISCEREKRTGFSIEFSDGSIISEKDINYYDSSTCIFFLRNKITLPDETGTPPDVIYPEFSVYLDKEKIYDGIIYPALVAAISPSPFFIPDPTAPTDIIPIAYAGFHTNTNDVRNDTRIIDYFDKSNLLHHGISCIIDSVFVNSYVDSSVTCTFTIRNNDNVNYYIPDPIKMGAHIFNNYTGGGLSLKNKESNEYHWSIQDVSPGWDVLTMDELTLLESKGEISFTYTSSFYPKIGKGIYEGDLRFLSMYHFRSVTLTLDQENGRVWVGGLYSRIDNVIFDL